MAVKNSWEDRLFDRLDKNIAEQQALERNPECKVCRSVYTQQYKLKNGRTINLCAACVPKYAKDGPNAKPTQEPKPARAARPKVYVDDYVTVRLKNDSKVSGAVAYVDHRSISVVTESGLRSFDLADDVKSIDRISNDKHYR